MKGRVRILVFTGLSFRRPTFSRIGSTFLTSLGFARQRIGHSVTLSHPLHRFEAAQFVLDHAKSVSRKLAASDSARTVPQRAPRQVPIRDKDGGRAEGWKDGGEGP